MRKQAIEAYGLEHGPNNPNAFVAVAKRLHLPVPDGLGCRGRDERELRKQVLRLMKQA